MADGEGGNVGADTTSEVENEGENAQPNEHIEWRQTRDYHGLCFVVYTAELCTQGRRRWGIREIDAHTFAGQRLLL